MTWFYLFTFLTSDDLGWPRTTLNDLGRQFFRNTYLKGVYATHALEMSADFFYMTWLDLSRKFWVFMTSNNLKNYFVKKRTPTPSIWGITWLLLTMIEFWPHVTSNSLMWLRTQCFAANCFLTLLIILRSRLEKFDEFVFLLNNKMTKQNRK